MLTNMKKELEEARKHQYAIPQFNINNLEWTKYILEECENQNNPVILGISESTIEYIGGYQTVVNMILGLISDLNITIPVSIHLDHGSSLESCEKAIKAGFTSVMIDVSSKSLEENIKETKKVIQLADNKILTEAEVGVVGRKEQEKNYANLEDCQKLSNIGIDLLAPAIGNQHGIYKGQADLNFNLLEDISKVTNIPLVLHGASGMQDTLILRCIKNGISKINFNTDLQIAWSKEIRKYIEQNENEYDPRKIIKSGELAIKNTIKEKIELLNSCRQ